MPDDIAAAAAALGIAVDPAWVPAIRFHLDLSLRLAMLVAEQPIDDALDPAPVFSA